ncbi:MAG: arylsulfatase [Verrucomicrobiota bacterium]|nr:arylsulfatase [Verrucomicrobiota bacterium]MDP7441255.1 arylsulfatase [Verrucomicrobiota bacterium]
MRLIPALFSSALMVAAIPLGQAARPNVILVMTDDQGYPELSAHGNPVLNTPFLDRLHTQSVRFIDYHASPMCTPTRGSLMTGLDPARHGAINVSSGRTLLRANLPTMADLLREQGYRTGIFGKWHLGDNYPYRPQDRGFEETLWFPSSHIGSVPDHWGNNYFDDTYRWNGKRKRFTGYCTDIFFDHAIDWIKRSAAAGEPFFAYLPTNTPHGPFYAPDEDIEVMEEMVANARLPRMTPRTKSNLVRYLAMIRNVDTNMGRLMAFLDESGLAENTILLFMTDNGSTFGHAYFPAGMRGRKTELWEGGHRVPCFVRWPGGGLGKPRDIGGLTQTQDLLPTLLDLCDAKTECEFDGISLAPAMRGQADVPAERMLVTNYSRMPGSLDFPTPDSPSILRRNGGAVLWKRWRMLRDSELYNLKTDPLQKKNVIDNHPEVAAKMRTHLDKWWASVGDIANEPQRVIIGSDAENPMMLTACEWLDVFIDQQGQIRRGDQKNGYWELDVTQAGRYEFELRRWPREADLPLGAGYNGEGALPIRQARLFINRNMTIQPVKPSDKAATFTVTLPKGQARLHTWFAESRTNPICGAYYVYVKRL